MDFEFLIVRREGPVAWLEYNRPPRNAFHTPMVREVRQALEALIAER